MNEEYINIKDIAKAKGLKSTRSLRIEINKPESRYISREIKVNGGTSYEILFSSLEPELQQKLRECETKSTALIPLNYQPPVVTDKARQTANHRINLVKAALEHRKKYTTHNQADHEFLELYNTGIFLPKAYEFMGSISIGTLRRYIQAYKKNGNAECLLPQYQTTKQGEYKGILNEDMKKVLLALLLHQNKFGYNTAIRLAKQILIKQGYDEESLPSNITFKRFAEYFRDNNYAEWTLKREGIKAYHDKVEPYIERDISKIEVGDVIIADGHLLNFQVINPFTGKPTRATLVGFLDWKSTALVGYEIMMSENTQCVASALRNSILNLGLIPKVVYQDNGKAFKAKYFIENGITGLFTNLGIQPIYAKPYNAKAKPIERLFREMQDSFEVMLPSYTGTSIVKKPAQLKRNEKLHKEIFKVNIPTIEQVARVLEIWLQKYHYEQPCPHVEGKTIGEVLESGRGEGVNIDTLDDLMMVREIKTIYRNGILFLKNNYYDEALFGYKKKVIIKYSLFDLSSIKVYKLNGEFLCIAKRVEPVHPLANYLGDIKDIEDLKQKTKLKKQLEKRTEQEYINHLKRNQVYTPLLTMDLPEKQEEDEIKQFSLEVKADVQAESFNGCFKTRFEKYEHLLTKDKLTKSEQDWISEYKLTDEYEQIYGEEDNKEVFNA